MFKIFNRYTLKANKSLKITNKKITNNRLYYKCSPKYRLELLG